MYTWLAFKANTDCVFRDVQAEAEKRWHQASTIVQLKYQ
jgi:hypothetical protein